MLREIVTLGLVFLVQAQELQEGSECTRDGVKGVCRKSKVCPSVALHFQDSGILCNNDADDPVVCCTDCHIDDVRNAAVTLDGIVWKTGGVKKCCDKCVEYASTLPYECKRNATRYAVSKVYDEAGSCHRLQVTVKHGSATTGKPRVDYPHLVLLGYGKTSSTLEVAQWKCQGFIISNRFIVTTAHCGHNVFGMDLKYVATSIEFRYRNFFKGVDSNWQVYDVKRIITHPDYKPPQLYNDIGLVETETDIRFGQNVLPICLYDRTWDAGMAWVEALSINGTTESRKVSLQKLGKEECDRLYPVHRLLPTGINHTSMVCYGDFEEHPDSCVGCSGRPLYITGELKCMKYVTALMSFGRGCGDPSQSSVYTRIDAFIPWIEKEVWPEH